MPMSEAVKVFTRAIALVTAERQRQDSKWGEQNHEAPVWSLIATEELGEVAEAALEVLFEGSQAVKPKEYVTRRDLYMAELVQLTAVCFAWLECEIRKEAGHAHESR